MPPADTRRPAAPPLPPRRPAWLPAASVALALCVAAAVPARAQQEKPTAAPPAPPAEKAAPPQPAAPQPSSDTLQKELSEIIDAQLAAFRASDFVKAYSFAAAPIKSLYPQNDFIVMVRTGYPAIANSKRAEYGLSFDTGEQAVINVRVEDAKGQPFQFQYLLQKENGQWKISGVTEDKPAGISV